MAKFLVFLNFNYRLLFLSIF